MTDRSRHAVSSRVTAACTFHPFTNILIIGSDKQVLFGYTFRNLIGVIAPGEGYRRVKGSPIRTKVIRQPDNMARWWGWARVNICRYGRKWVTVFLQGNGADRDSYD